MATSIPLDQKSDADTENNETIGKEGNPMKREVVLNAFKRKPEKTELALIQKRRI